MAQSKNIRLNLIMKDIKEKIRNLSKKDRKILDLIAIGTDHNHSIDSCKKLEKLELIYQDGMLTVGRDAFGAIKTPVWRMPIFVHIDWCELCSEEEGELL